MFVPIGDQPNPKGTAWANLSLIAINLAIYLLVTLPLSWTPVSPATPELEEFLHEVSRATGQHPLAIAQGTSEYDVFTFRHGFRPSQPSFADLLFSMFLHGGLAHLLGNMLFLWIFGDNVENRLGPVKYVLAYLGTGVAATLVHATFAQEQSLPMVGASGAISGVLGFYFVWFPENKVRMLLWFYFFVDVILVPAPLVLAFYLIVENLVPFLFAPSTHGVAYGAHVGGFAAGWVLARWLDGRDAEAGVRRWRRSAHPDAELDAREYAALPRAERARQPAPEVARMARGVAERGYPDAALAMLREYAALAPGAPGLAHVHAEAAAVCLELSQPAAAYQHLVMALRSDPDDEVRAAVTRMMAEVR